MMRKIYLLLIPGILILASFASFESNELKDKYANPASENKLAERVYLDMASGRTDSLFLHLTEIYYKAGWRKYVPYYNDEREPTLIQQDYRVPFSNCASGEITQSRLMDSLSQGWKYWQMWSDSLTNSTWKPSASIKDEKEAYLLGNYTIMVIMAHELGHFYASGNMQDDLSGTMAENIADHFAMAMLQDLVKADNRFAGLLNRFRQVFMKDIYNAVPAAERAVIPDGFTLYEQTYYFYINSNFKPYATMQLVRENIILDLPGLNLRSCVDVFREGMHRIAYCNKVRLYADSIRMYNVCKDTVRFTAQQSQNMYDAFYDNSSRAGAFQDGDLYAYQLEGGILKLNCLTNDWGEHTYDLSALKPRLDSIAGFDISTRNGSKMVSFVFQDTTSFVLYIAGEYTSGTQKIICVGLKGAERPEITGVKYIETTTQSKIRSFYFTSISAKGPTFVGYDAMDKSIIIQPKDSRHYFTTIIKKDTIMANVPDMGENQAVARSMYGINFGVDTSGNVLYAYRTNIKYQKNNLLYTVFIDVGTESRGVDVDMDDRRMIWSSKYGFVGTAAHSDCISAVKLK